MSVFSKLLFNFVWVFSWRGSADIGLSVGLTRNLSVGAAKN